MTRRLLIAAVVVVACTRPATPDPGWRGDLRALAAELSTHHKNPFFHVPQDVWRKAVSELDARLPQLDDAHAIVGFVRIAAMIGDSHTHVNLPRMRLYPVQLLWFDDGVFVGGAAAADAWAIGKRVMAIGGHPIADVLATVGALVPHENDAWLRNEVPAMLSDPVVLVGTDLVAGDTATFALAGARALVVTAGAGVELAPPKVLPLHLRGPTRLAYWNTYVAEQRLLYLQYNDCANDDRVGPFAKFAADTLAFADQHPVDRFVIDLRSNTGGNSAILEPLVDGLAARPALAGRVFVLIGRSTFSSAVMNASELKRRLGATLVGTPTGGTPNGYGEVKRFTLPHSHLDGQYSTKLWSDERYRGDTIPPDELVHVTSDDWFSGRDPAMDAVLATPVPAPSAR